MLPAFVTPARAKPGSAVMIASAAFSPPAVGRLPSRVTASIVAAKVPGVRLDMTKDQVAAGVTPA